MHTRQEIKYSTTSNPNVEREIQGLVFLFLMTIGNQLLYQKHHELTCFTFHIFFNRLCLTQILNNYIQHNKENYELNRKKYELARW